MLGARQVGKHGVIDASPNTEVAGAQRGRANDHGFDSAVTKVRILRLERVPDGARFLVTETEAAHLKDELLTIEGVADGAFVAFYEKPCESQSFWRRIFQPVRVHNRSLA